VRAPVARHGAWLLLVGLVTAPPARAQAGEPLRKTDLVRLLSGAMLEADELPALVRRNCLSFTPTGRDRADFVALGADSALLREIDACARRAATRVAAPPAATAPPAPPAPPAATPVSAARTGFILGAGQHAAVGTRPLQELVFEVRDTAGLPVPGQVVVLAASNGHVGQTRAVADSAGRVSVDLTMGVRVGPVVVRATAGAIEREATTYADPGPAVRLLFRCGETTADRRIAFTPNVAVVLRVAAQDAFGTAVPVTSLQAATGDRGVLRVGFVGTDGAGGLVRVQPGDEGSTSLVVVAARHREDVSATVARHPASGMPTCP